MSDGRTHVLTYYAYLPNKNTPRRPDKGLESSVNWEDDESVEARTLAEPHSAFGAGRLLTSVVERINVGPNTKDTLVAERKQIHGNLHHGNLVFRHDLDPAITRLVADALCVDSVFIPPKKAPVGADR